MRELMLRECTFYYPTFSASVNSYPIPVGRYAWGAIVTAGSVTFSSLTPRTIFEGDPESFNPNAAYGGTLITMKDIDDADITAITIGANAAKPIPQDVFRYGWMVLVSNASMSSSKASPELVLILKG